MLLATSAQPFLAAHGRQKWSSCQLPRLLAGNEGYGVWSAAKWAFMSQIRVFMKDFRAELGKELKGVREDVRELE